MARFERHDAAVDERYRPLLVIGVRGLDDALEFARRGQDKPAVGRGVGRPQRRDQDRRPGPSTFGEHPAQCLGGQKRRVAKQHQDILDPAIGHQPAAEPRECGTHRVAGAERWVLDRYLGRGHGLRHRRHARADHDDRRRRLQRLQRGQEMCDHRPPGDGMQDLGMRGFHSGAAAGGKNDHSEAGLAHQRLELERDNCRSTTVPLQHTDCYKV